MFKDKIAIIYQNQLHYIDFLQNERDSLIERQEYLEYTEFFPKLKTLDSMLKDAINTLNEIPIDLDK